MVKFIGTFFVTFINLGPVTFGGERAINEMKNILLHAYFTTHNILIKTIFEPIKNISLTIC